MDHPAHAEAVEHLRRVDPVLGQLIQRVDRIPPAPPTDGTHLGALARAIVFQQLSGKAARTIHGRFEGVFGGRAPTAHELLAAPDEQLRAAGLSRAKVTYLKDLAARAVSGALPVDRLHELEDAALLEALTDVKGIGRWTAQMVLLFRLGRTDVLPDLDLGIRKGMQYVYGLPRLPTPREVLARGAVWSPYASFASWYLWRSLDLPEASGMRRRKPKKKAAKRRRAAKNRDVAGPAKRPRLRSRAAKNASRSTHRTAKRRKASRTART